MPSDHRKTLIAEIKSQIAAITKMDPLTFLQLGMSPTLVSDHATSFEDIPDRDLMAVRNHLVEVKQ